MFTSKSFNFHTDLKAVYTNSTNKTVSYFICNFCEKKVETGLTNIFKHFDVCKRQKEYIDRSNQKLLNLLNLQ